MGLKLKCGRNPAHTPQVWIHIVHEKMGITRIRMISSGFLSSTGIPFTSFNSSPAWISPSTHKHKCTFPQNVIYLFSKFDLDTVLRFGAQTRFLKHDIHADWLVFMTGKFQSWKISTCFRQGRTTGGTKWALKQADSILAESWIWKCTCKSWSYLRNRNELFLSSWVGG